MAISVRENSSWKAEARTYPPVGGYQDVFHSRSATVPLPLIEKASGIYMWDDGGREYIDASSGPVVSNIGHGNANVARAISDQILRMDYAYSRVARHSANAVLAERISRMAGPGFERVCFSSGGSESMEIALKLARQYAVARGDLRRNRFISCEPGYHGSTLGTLALAGDSTMSTFLDGLVHLGAKVPAPLTYRVPHGFTAESYTEHCIRQVEEKFLELGPERVLGFVMEPVGGLASGCLVPSARYMDAVREICSKYGAFLIYDEVLCGTGRTGKFLAAEHWPEARPDIVVLAKGLGSGYVPLGAVLAPARMIDEIAQSTGFNFMHTYAANPVACAAGIAVLEEYERHDLVGAAASRGRHLRAHLLELQRRFPAIGDIRGLGLLMAVEIVEDPETKKSFDASVRIIERIRRAGLDNGLILYARQTAGGKYGDWFMVSPPLTITEAECDELAARLGRTFSDVFE
jgi:adenosylmethionine-8-amino-7-oxononanoate aminotransferase